MKGFVLEMAISKNPLIILVACLLASSGIQAYSQTRLSEESLRYPTKIYPMDSSELANRRKELHRRNPELHFLMNDFGFIHFLEDGPWDSDKTGQPDENFSILQFSEFINRNMDILGFPSAEAWEIEKIWCQFEKRNVCFVEASLKLESSMAKVWGTRGRFWIYENGVRYLSLTVWPAVCIPEKFTLDETASIRRLVNLSLERYCWDKRIKSTISEANVSEVKFNKFVVFPKQFDNHIELLVTREFQFREYKIYVDVMTGEIAAMISDVMC